MPPKRKRTEALAADQPPRTVRRSSRNTNTNTDTPTDGPHQDDPRGSRQSLERTKRELGEMALKLENDVKKQRLAVETSHLSSYNVEKAREPAMQAKPTPRKRENARHKEEPDTTGQGPPSTAGVESDRDTAESEGAEKTLEADGDERCAIRPPPVNSDRQPLPWIGRLGYACLNTYLRLANPPVFCSRTCRISSIIEHRHPLRDPTQPEHPSKNRPDKTQAPDVRLGLKYIQDLGLANAMDIVKMLRWNEKYGIRFLRLSSDMFPFASHEGHGYKLAPFAAEVLAEAGKVAVELGHRLTTHPGQYTQIASPRKEVVTAAIRDLEYHHEMLSLLKLSEQQDRDAVMILHMGGTYGDKAATLDRFRENYAKLSDGVKRRLVLENDDVSWSVHDLLPICEELNIPLVLDFHHHNIIFDSSIREGTLDIMSLYDRISKTWTRKKIKQKMHYSEPTAGAITPRERRKHSARVKTLPPCDPDMDLMIEAKDKEQAVFELMRTFKLPGWDRFNDIVPFEREDEARKSLPKKTQKANKGKQASDEAAEKTISPEDFGMGGPQSRVYWSEGMEDWLRPRKRETNKGKKAIDKD